ncbi:MAG: SPOR domain-containing protein [Candidatus Omnitrophica bacterium]|nr:SPOR domain-containing protein [Candidatus Omnitrophota bacterium]
MKESPSQAQPSGGLKILKESEIQDRLYGQYLGRKRKEAPLVQPAAGSAPEWTGREILEGEMMRLRTELISLRKEREDLLSRLTSPQESRSRGPILSLAKWVGLSVLLALLGYPLGARMIQAASPPMAEPTPYTVQVAVYDVRPMAERMQEYLQGLGYTAFLSGLPNRYGKVRYRIYVGRFVTREEAELERIRLTSDPRFSDAFVKLQ